MGTKTTYQIPDSLDKGYLDFEISLSSKNNIGAKPMPFKVIVLAIGALFILMTVLSSGWLNAAGIGCMVLFVIVYLVACVILIKPDKTGALGYTRIPIILDYFSSPRKISTRRSANAGPFYQIANIEAIDGETGLIKFADGTVGAAYAVVGAGSILLFDDDRDAIIRRVDSFWRKLETSYEIEFITLKEAQKVDSAAQAMEIREQMALQSGYYELAELASSERYVLTDNVAVMFRSIHQYMIVKAENVEALMSAMGTIDMEAQNSMLMFKRVSALIDNSAYEVFAKIFRGADEHNIDSEVAA